MPLGLLKPFFSELSKEHAIELYPSSRLNFPEGQDGRHPLGQLCVVVPFGLDHRDGVIRLKRIYNF
jgi:hypothetical protein